MDLTILGNARDIRTKSYIIYAQMPISDYLQLIGDNYDMYGIQRKREKHRAYARMKQDIIKGALLPTITLAANQNIVERIKTLIVEDNKAELLTQLKVSGNYSILDGLQRTNILKDLQNEGIKFKEGQKLLLEFKSHTIVCNNLLHLIIRLF